MNETLTEFLLARIAERPCGERVALYRALAAQTNDKALATNCRQIADSLEAVERTHHQLALDFKRRNAS